MVGLKFLYIKLGWVLKDKNPTTFYPPLNRSTELTTKSPLERGRGCVYSRPQHKARPRCASSLDGSRTRVRSYISLAPASAPRIKRQFPNSKWGNATEALHSIERVNSASAP